MNNLSNPQTLLLEKLNEIICKTKDNYLWRELSEYDNCLRDYFTSRKEENINDCNLRSILDSVLDNISIEITNNLNNIIELCKKDDYSFEDIIKKLEELSSRFE